jgi:type IV fimbrial biogenesis protein FimT
VLTPLPKQQGVTLIELMIGIVIFAILLAIALPNFSSFISNSNIRNGAEAIQNGLSLARVEALRRNTQVNFSAGTDSSWSLGCTTRVPDNDGDGVDDCPTVIAQRPAAEGSRQAQVAMSEVVATTGAAAGTAVFTNMLTFNGLGRIVTSTLAPADNAVFDVSNTTGGGTCAVAGGKMRCLRVIVTPAGQVRMCDPALTVSKPTDPQAC